MSRALKSRIFVSELRDKGSAVPLAIRVKQRVGSETYVLFFGVKKNKEVERIPGRTDPGKIPETIHAGLRRAAEAHLIKIMKGVTDGERKSGGSGR